MALVDTMLDAAIENCDNQRHGFTSDDRPLCKECIIKFALDYADAVHE